MSVCLSRCPEQDTFIQIYQEYKALTQKPACIYIYIYNITRLIQISWYLCYQDTYSATVVGMISSVTTDNLFSIVTFTKFTDVPMVTFFTAVTRLQIFTRC